jgi:hypothetical protein
MIGWGVIVVACKIVNTISNVSLFKSHDCALAIKLSFAHVTYIGTPVTRLNADAPDVGFPFILSLVITTRFGAIMIRTKVYCHRDATTPDLAPPGLAPWIVCLSNSPNAEREPFSDGIVMPRAGRGPRANGNTG